MVAGGREAAPLSTRDGGWRHGDGSSGRGDGSSVESGVGGRQQPEAVAAHDPRFGVGAPCVCEEAVHQRAE